MASYSTNPYGQFVEPTSKKFITLSNNAITNFKSDKVFSLEPTSSDGFCEHIETLAKRFSYYEMIKRVPTDYDIDATNPNIITYRNYKNFIATW